MEKQTKVKQWNISFYKQYFLNDMKIRKKTLTNIFIWMLKILNSMEKLIFCDVEYVSLNIKKIFFEEIGLQNSFFNSVTLCCGFYYKWVEIFWDF